MDGTTTGILLLCGLWTVPMLLGFVLGRAFERRYVDQGWLGLLPGFIRNIIERNL
jgi:hypothetical protein